jgi:glutathione S-transferase
MRARMALLVSETPFELREVKLSAKPAEMLVASPKGTVPVLVLPNGHVIDESLDIMRWALLRHDPENWLDGVDAALIEANDGPFKLHLDRYKYADRHGTNAVEHRSAALALLVSLESRLTGQRWLCGERQSLTDVALTPFVRQFAATDEVWFGEQPLPGVQRWLAHQLASPLFERAMMRQETWRPADRPAGMSRTEMGREWSWSAHGTPR